MEKTGKIMEHLQQLKNDCGMTNQQIADLAGYSAATVQRYLSGTAKDAPVETISRIIAAMGGDPSEILGESAPPPDRSAEIALYERYLSDLRTTHTDQLRYYRRWIRVLSVAVVVLFLLIITLLLIDITSPSIGWFHINP